MTTNYNLFKALTSSAGVAYDTDATALFARMTVQPDATRKGLINNLITSLKSAGVWALCDILYILAAHDAQAARLNWKGNDTYNLTAVNAPTYTTDRGYQGNGTSSSLRTQWNSTLAAQYARDSAHLSIWSSTVRAGAAGVAAGADTGGIQTYIYPRFSDGNCYTSVNDNGGGLVNANSNGHIMGSRTASTGRVSYRNGASLGTVTIASSAPPTGELYILAGASGGVPSEWTTDVITQASAGAGLTGTQATAYYNALQTFMTAVGAP